LGPHNCKLSLKHKSLISYNKNSKTINSVEMSVSPTKPEEVNHPLYELRLLKLEVGFKSFTTSLKAQKLYHPAWILRCFEQL